MFPLWVPLLASVASLRLCETRKDTSVHPSASTRRQLASDLEIPVLNERAEGSYRALRVDEFNF